MSDAIIQVAVPGPFARLFDYLHEPTQPPPPPGTRVQVPFGRGHRVGVVVGHAGHSELPRDRLRPIAARLDAAPSLPSDLLWLAQWSAEYYQHPLGEVLATLLPAPLRRDRPSESTAEPPRWRITAAGRHACAQGLRGQPARQRLLEAIGALPEGADGAHLRLVVERYRRPLAALEEAGFVERFHRAKQPPAIAPAQGPALLPAQRAAAEAIRATHATFQVFLLQGVTGSGKTEVYCTAMEPILCSGDQVLILVPEIGLTPQLLDRLRQRLGTAVDLLHSGLSNGERLAAWRRAASGEARVILGTRSAVFVPLARPGLIVVDEEHDSALKQQDGFRYHARDLAVVRARQIGIPLVLGSATPALESLNNVARGHYRRLRLDERAGSARSPALALVDVRRRRLDEGLSAPLCEAMQRHLDAGSQVLLFINRRGWAPTLICNDCGWVAECDRCDARMTVHQHSASLRCHHCGAQQPVATACPACGSPRLVHLGEGTERVEAALARRFAAYTTIRIDRDSTRRRGALAAGFERIRAGEAQILLGTQMLAKGHDFPGVTLVGILDADRGLFSADFRGPEHLAQTVLQVAGRAGRAENPGEVLIQSRNPEHPLLQALIHEGYDAVAATLLAERRSAQLPPATRMALVRAEAPTAAAPKRALSAVRDQVTHIAVAGVTCYGPAPAPMERLAGRYRAQLLLQATNRRPLAELFQTLRPWLEKARETRAVRWSIDIDPVDML